VSKQLEYFFDYASPYTYLANSQVASLVERTGATLVNRPMLLGGLMVATGNSPPGTVPAKAGYMAADIERWLSRYDLPFKFTPHFPPRTITALRATLVALDEGSFDVLQPAIFKAVWVDGVDPNDPDALSKVIDGAGLDGAGILGRCSEPAIKDALRLNTEEAEKRGAFGAPTFFVGDEMFFGNDRIEFVEEALKR
jgi:2-hydroxychromene-2-carboxylate isomerase